MSLGQIRGSKKFCAESTWKIGHSRNKHDSPCELNGNGSPPCGRVVASLGGVVDNSLMKIRNNSGLEIKNDYQLEVNRW